MFYAIEIEGWLALLFLEDSVVEIAFVMELLLKMLINSLQSVL